MIRLANNTVWQSQYQAYESNTSVHKFMESRSSAIDCTAKYCQHYRRENIVIPKVIKIDKLQ